MDKIIPALLSADMPITFMMMLIMIGFLMYMLFNKNRHVENENKQSIEALQIIINEQHTELEKMSKVVYEFKKQLEKEQEEKFKLKEEILELKEINAKLRNTVERLEYSIQVLTEENKRLREEK